MKNMLFLTALIFFVCSCDDPQTERREEAAEERLEQKADSLEERAEQLEDTADVLKEQADDVD